VRLVIKIRLAIAGTRTVDFQIRTEGVVPAGLVSCTSPTSARFEKPTQEDNCSNRRVVRFILVFFSFYCRTPFDLGSLERRWGNLLKLFAL
jgi:hypothetical protein